MTARFFSRSSRALHSVVGDSLKPVLPITATHISYLLSSSKMLIEGGGYPPLHTIMTEALYCTDSPLAGVVHIADVIQQFFASRTSPTLQQMFNN